MKGYRVIIEIEGKESVKMIERFMKLQFGQEEDEGYFITVDEIDED
jgi:hypothetical protein